EEGARPRPPALVDLQPLCEHADRRSIIGDRLAALSRMKQVRVKVHVEALQQMTVMRENARLDLAFPGYAVDLCTMAGMLGTFIGLCMMLLQMQGVMPGSGVPAAGGFAEASASLGGIIASKKTAFVTTLVGLACAIVISFLNFLLVRAQSAFYDELERFTVAELLPATVPAVEDETMMEKLSLQLAESFATLDEVAKNQREYAELQKGVQEAFTTTVASIRTLALTAASRGPEAESGGALAGLVQQMAAANTSLVRAAESVAQSARRAEGARDRAAPQRPAGWGALGSQLGGLAADAVGELRRNPVLALGGMMGVVVLAIIIW
ncbi:MAG TPA: MotA/TolQ/ExbB proton channel family protein, partial [Longimicrobium sp.]